MTTALAWDDLNARPDIQAEVTEWLDQLVPDQYVMVLHVDTDNVTGDCVPRAGIQTAPLTPDGQSLVTQPQHLGAPPPLLAAYVAERQLR